MPSSNNRWYGLDQLPADDIEMTGSRETIPTSIMNAPEGFSGIHIPGHPEDEGDEAIFDIDDDEVSESSSVYSRDLDLGPQVTTKN